MHPAIELRLLRYAVAVAEELHFSRAALRLHVTQPSLSKQIRQLEETLGVQLFERTNRAVQLTKAGRFFVQEATKALAHSKRAVELARQTDLGSNGCLQVGYTPRMNFVLLSLIRRLCLNHRHKFSVTLHSSPTQFQMVSLLNGDLHAGFVTLPLKNESLTVRSVIREPLVLVLPENHLFASKQTLLARELNNLPIILRARQFHPAAYDQLQKLLRKVGCQPKIVQEVTTATEAILLVKEGLGITLVKRSALPLDTRGIASATVSDLSLYEETGIAYRRDNRSARLQELIQLIKNNGAEFAMNCGSEAIPDSTRIHDPRQLELF